ncbi:MAG: succinylglutamate desuccinylase/aspartoacylase family protein [Myxococcales bacterium]|nr:succinylglutamate desuccinylase/aspartoacylase family protein [Myxococcales bacterium]
MTDWIEMHDVPAAPVLVDNLDLEHLPPGKHRIAIELADDPAGRPVFAPALVAKGARPGPVFGLTAAVHGNEINGMPTIHRLFSRIPVDDLQGTVVGVTIVNLPGYLRYVRTFPDGADLNRIMPGRADGNESQIYAHRVKTRILDGFDVLFDLHTASFGRVNTLYVRADMTHGPTAELARACGPEIIVHNAGADGSVRGTVAALGKPAVTLEIGNPQVVDGAKIRASRIGIRDAMEHLGMLPPDDQHAPTERTIECKSSGWFYTDAGGVLEVSVQLAQMVEEGEKVATLYDAWGAKIRTYHAPHTGVVVGKSTNPVARAGARIVHLGIVGAP